MGPPPPHGRHCSRLILPRLERPVLFFYNCRGLGGDSRRRRATSSSSCSSRAFHECGGFDLRVRAEGEGTGRDAGSGGACPNCGSPLKVPDVPAPSKASARRPLEVAEPGYHLEPGNEASVHVPSRSGPVRDRPLPGTFVERKKATSMADGVLPALEIPRRTGSRALPIRCEEPRAWA